jgi:hypothetical protein
MRIFISLMLLTLASCSWAGRQTHDFMNWSNCNMPTYSGERKDCESNDAAAQAKASARQPVGNMGAATSPWPHNGTPGMLPPSNHAGQSTAGADGSMPHNFGAANPPPKAKTDKKDDDFPDEYRNVQPGMAPGYDTMIPPPPI